MKPGQIISILALAAGVERMRRRSGPHEPGTHPRQRGTAAARSPQLRRPMATRRSKAAAHWIRVARPRARRPAAPSRRCHNSSSTGW